MGAPPPAQGLITTIWIAFNILLYTSDDFASKISLPLSKNYSFYTIPVYCILTYLPYWYSVLTIQNASKDRWDNANPKSTKHIDSVQKSVSSETFGRYERGKAAHNNGLENFPLLIVAVVMGNMAHLSFPMLNGMFGAFVLLRVAYTVAYIKISGVNASYLRSMMWMFSVSILMYITIRSAQVLAKSSVL
ncbi:MAG: hypothetical protein Q9214_004235 [Letrouitia sp. 1 TL-2023]